MLSKCKKKTDVTMAVVEKDSHEEIQESSPHELRPQLPSQKESGEHHVYC